MWSRSRGVGYFWPESKSESESESELESESESESESVKICATPAPLRDQISSKVQVP